MTRMINILYVSVIFTFTNQLEKDGTWVSFGQRNQLRHRVLFLVTALVEEI